jgi:hypothetical protein
LKKSVQKFVHAGFSIQRNSITKPIIKVNPNPNPKPHDNIEAQRALDICTDYGLAFDMTWSIKKCAVVGRCDNALILAGEVIPEVNNYKYLGVIHHSKGVDFNETYLLASAKQKSILTALSDHNWHPKVKLTIFRTFIRPISEYTMALTWIWAHRDLPSRMHILTTAQDAYKSALTWIFGCQKNFKIFEFVSGLDSLEYRMTCLTAGLARSLCNLLPSNPLMHARATFCISSSSHFILPFCFKSKVLTSFNKINKERIRKLRWKTHLMHELKRLQDQASLTYKMIAYYKP